MTGIQPTDEAASTAVVATLMVELGHVANEVVLGADQMPQRCLGCAAGPTGRMPARDLRILDQARQMFAMHLKSYRHTRRAPPPAGPANLVDGTMASIDATIRRLFPIVLEIAEQLDQRDWLPGSEVMQRLQPSDG